MSKIRYFRRSLPKGIVRRTCPDPNCRGKVKFIRKTYDRADPACPETEFYTSKYSCQKCGGTIWETSKQSPLKKGVVGMK